MGINMVKKFYLLYLLKKMIWNKGKYNPSLIFLKSVFNMLALIQFSFDIQVHQHNHNKINEKDATSCISTK